MTASVTTSLSRRVHGRSALRPTAVATQRNAGSRACVDEMSSEPSSKRFVIEAAMEAPTRSSARSASAITRCRVMASIEGRQQQLYGTACRQPDGSWQRVSRGLGASAAAPGTGPATSVWRAPGFQAPEPEIALRLGMSRTPVREALIRLEADAVSTWGAMEEGEAR